MPHIKNALIRFRIIDKMLRNKYNPFPSKKNMREIAKWCKNKAIKLIGENKKLDWLRLDNNNLVRRIYKIETKGSWI